MKLAKYLAKDRQSASAAVRIGNVFSAEARAESSAAGLLAIGAMVSAVLLGSAVIVAAARRRPRALRHDTKA